MMVKNNYFYPFFINELFTVSYSLRNFCIHYYNPINILLNFIGKLLNFDEA